eukprot:TRINITY_DN733_c0_g2_i1.p1 TRINITY_DN733_c0_g2~~TRINITY_DN733_c0_g2_i1.p1  ORF type:complete len:66 (+),score=10.29 TRINITY_DN733_c0_g2_i1:422-619(+)
MTFQWNSKRLEKYLTSCQNREFSPACFMILGRVPYFGEKAEFYLIPHVLCVDTGRSSETAKAHRG